MLDISKPYDKQKIISFIFNYLEHYSSSQVQGYFGKLFYFAAKLNWMSGEIQYGSTASTVLVPVLGLTSLQPFLIGTGK